MKPANEDRINENHAVYFAMVKAGFEAKPKLTPAQFARRYAREAVAQQRRYCDAFALWRSCPRKSCRRHRRCLGYITDCLKRALRAVPRQAQVQAQRTLLKGVPRNIGAPERKARLAMPGDFYE